MVKTVVLVTGDELKVTRSLDDCPGDVEDTVGLPAVVVDSVVVTPASVSCVYPFDADVHNSLVTGSSDFVVSAVKAVVFSDDVVETVVVAEAAPLVYDGALDELEEVPAVSGSVVTMLPLVDEVLNSKRVLSDVVIRAVIVDKELLVESTSVVLVLNGVVAVSEDVVIPLLKAGGVGVLSVSVGAVSSLDNDVLCDDVGVVPLVVLV